MSAVPRAQRRHPIARGVAVAAAIASLVAACAGDPAPPGGCEWTRTICIHPDDRLSRPTVDQVLEHNLTRKRLCGEPADPCGTRAGGDGDDERRAGPALRGNGHPI